MSGIPAPPIITCPAWGARPPKRRPQLAGRPVRSIFHHTAGRAATEHGVNVNQRARAIAFAQLLQRDMMDRRGWNDSGHNFLVMRSGLILQGRWGTVTAVEHGRMVVSAHCPGQNDQPGVEHEHVAGAELTDVQEAASVWLHAWIFDRCGIRPTEIYPHGHFFPTDCPGELTGSVPLFRLKVAGKLGERRRRRPARMTPLARLQLRSG